MKPVWHVMEQLAKFDPDQMVDVYEGESLEIPIYDKSGSIIQGFIDLEEELV